MCTLYLSACSTTADGDLQVQQQAQPAVSPGQNQDGVVGKTRPVVSPQQNSDGVSGNTCSGLGSCLHSSPLVPRYQDYLLSSTNMKHLSQTVNIDAFPSWSLFRNSSPTHAGGEPNSTGSQDGSEQRHWVQDWRGQRRRKRLW